MVAGLALLALLIGLVIALRSPWPGPVSDALGDWEDRAYSKASAPLRNELAKSAELSRDAAFARALLVAIDDDAGRSALSSLLDDTRLGRSPVMAAELSEIALGEPGARRNAALRLLRKRQDLLSAEPRARVAYRDAVDCEALHKAVEDLTRTNTSGAKDDLDGHNGGRCQKLLRRDELCGCLPPAPPKRRKR
ncbi:MAG: hypothetical protein R3B70_36375 [Polyangiaceae bacterium]